jgi:hypothetical protein
MTTRQRPPACLIEPGAFVVGARDATEVIADVSYLTVAVPAELFDELAAEHLMPIAVDRP